MRIRYWGDIDKRLIVRSEARHHSNDFIKILASWNIEFLLVSTYRLDLRLGVDKISLLQGWADLEAQPQIW